MTGNSADGNETAGYGAPSRSSSPRFLILLLARSLCPHLSILRRDKKGARRVAGVDPDFSPARTFSKFARESRTDCGFRHSGSRNRTELARSMNRERETDTRPALWPVPHFHP